MPSTAMREFFDKLDRLGLMVTYGDVRLLPRHSDVLPTGTDVSSRFSRNVHLKIPIVSSPMDTVTTAEMAIAMAEAGGLGVIHRNLSPEKQASEVGRVKHRVHGRIETPIVVREDDTVEAVLRMREEKQFTFHTFPVLDSSGRVVGLLTRNDFDFCADLSQLVRETMTPFEHLLTASGRITAREAYDLMSTRKKKVLPLMGSDGKLEGMYVFSDLKRDLFRNSEHNVDRNGQFVVGAAVGVGQGALERAELLAAKKCDLFQIDTAHGDSKAVLHTIRILKQHHPDIDVIAGNVSRGDAAKSLVDAGADGILVGQGPGSICTTRVVAGVGTPQVSAVYECVQALRESPVPVCADGGITNSGDMVIALAVGAASVMLGWLLAGTEESPGEKRVEKGIQVKNFRGMGSVGAMRGSAGSRERYGQAQVPKGKLVPEGVEGTVPYRGTVRSILDQYVGGIRSGMGYCGAQTIVELANRAELARMSSAGLAESHPHDVTITIPAPNYFGRSS